MTNTPRLRSYAWNIVQIKTRELKGGKRMCIMGKPKKSWVWGGVSSLATLGQPQWEIWQNNVFRFFLLQIWSIYCHIWPKIRHFKILTHWWVKGIFWHEKHNKVCMKFLWLSQIIWTSPKRLLSQMEGHDFSLKT